MDEHPMSDMKRRIIDSAQEFIQRNGYNGFSFRDIAAKVGIRSASIHHHFPTKSDLAAAVVRSYTDRVRHQAAEFEASAMTPAEKLDWFAGFIKTTLTDDGKMCLCGMLGAECNSLPPEVVRETAAFFKVTLGWLAGVLGGGKSGEQRARNFLASMEGALILAKSLDDTALLDTVSASAIREALR